MMTCEKLDKDVILTFDAIAVEPTLHYDSKNDRVVGFEDSCSELQLPTTSSVVRDAANSIIGFHDTRSQWMLEAADWLLCH